MTLFLPELPLRRYFDATPGWGSEVGPEQGQPEGVAVDDRTPAPPILH